MTQRSVWSRLAVAIVVVAGLAVDARAQDSTRAMSQVLLKRLAEAVDGHQGAGEVFAVASYDSLSPVIAVFRTRREADSVRVLLGPSYGLFGPLIARNRDPLGILNLNPVMAGCVHDHWSSAMDRYRLVTSGRAQRLTQDRICPQWVHRYEDVQSISMTFHLRNGRDSTIILDPSVDAIFLSLPAIDKFVLPYYERIVGMDAAATMRRDIVDRVARQAGIRNPD